MDTITIARNVFQEIQNAFPSITMELQEDHEYVDLNMDIAKQDGIAHPINLNLQNDDELHFTVSNFWFSWFPCTDRKRVTAYREAVIGYIRGEYRILEHFHGKKFYKGKLQSCENGTWSTVARLSTLAWPISFKKTQVVVKNV